MALREAIRFSFAFGLLPFPFPFTIPPFLRRLSLGLVFLVPLALFVGRAVGFFPGETGVGVCFLGVGFLVFGRTLDLGDLVLGDGLGVREEEESDDEESLELVLWLLPRTLVSFLDLGDGDFSFLTFGLPDCFSFTSFFLSFPFRVPGWDFFNFDLTSVLAFTALNGLPFPAFTLRLVPTFFFPALSPFSNFLTSLALGETSLVGEPLVVAGLPVLTFDPLSPTLVLSPAFGDLVAFMTFRGEGEETGVEESEDSSECFPRF